MDSSWLFGIFLILASIGIAIGGIVVVRMWVSPTRLRNHNEIAGPIHATVGVVYAVILAFVVVVVWEQLNVAHEAVIYEGGELVALNHDLRALGTEEANDVHVALEAYTRAVLTKEWPTLEEDVYVIRSTPEYRALWAAVRHVEADDRTERVWLETMIDRLNRIDQWRSQRLLAVENSVPGPLWILLICGGIVTVLFTALFGAEHPPIHMVMVSALAALIAFTLFLIAAIDHPFRGVVRVEPEAFHHALEQIEAEYSVEGYR